MQISYNILNLPQSVTQSGTTKATYGWFADGTKYSVLDAQGNGYYYIGSLIYSSTAGTTALESTDFSGGRIVMNGNTQTIHYHHKDHLGSIRAVTDTNGTVIEHFEILEPNPNKPGKMVVRENIHIYLKD